MRKESSTEKEGYYISRRHQVGKFPRACVVRVVCVLCVYVCVVCASSIYGVDFLIVRDRREKIAQDTASLNWLMQLMSHCKEAAEAAPLSPLPLLLLLPLFQALNVPWLTQLMSICWESGDNHRQNRLVICPAQRKMTNNCTIYVCIYIYITRMIYTCCCWGNCSAIL